MRRFLPILFALLALAGLAALAPAATAAPRGASAKDQLEFGVKMAMKGSWREAAFRFKKAIQTDPENPYAHNNLGVALETVGEYQEALEAYTRALELLPEHDRIQENKGRLEAYLNSRRYMATVRPGSRAAGSDPPEDPDKVRNAGKDGPDGGGSR